MTKENGDQNEGNFIASYRIQARYSGRIVDEHKAEAAIFDGNWAKVKGEILEWRAGDLKQGDEGTNEKSPV